METIMPHAAHRVLARALNIDRVQAIPLNIEVAVQVPGGQKQSALSCVLVRVDTASGLTGCGLTVLPEEEVVAPAIEHIPAAEHPGQSRTEERKVEKVLVQPS